MDVDPRVRVLEAEETIRVAVCPRRLQAAHWERGRAGGLAGLSAAARAGQRLLRARATGALAGLVFV